MYKKILVPLDGSPLAEAILPHAQALAKSEGAEIVLLRVSQPPAPEFLARDVKTGARLVEEMEQEARQYVEVEVQRLRDDGNQVTGIARDGAVLETIVSVARETHADVIAMSTHARSGLQHFLLGSVADDLVHISPIPVMLIHPN
ncbi:MAG: universal stress protein [Chloroflexi bacterium]|nr:universal stress protein [Chloroflexota bacterium]